ncbi:MAG: type III secretion system gatekeeper subunit SctW [Chlamydiales bacterium]
MTSPIPLNLSRIMAKAAFKQAQKLIARQEGATARLMNQMQESFNPAAANRAQARMNRSQSLQMRRPRPSEARTRVQRTSQKGEQDLAKEFNKRNPELQASLLQNVRRGLKESHSPEEILEQINEAFEDPTLADEAFEYLERTTDGVIKSNVLLARELLISQKSREIIAGRNIDPAAKSFYEKGIGKSPTDLRELYRDVTGNPRDHNTLFSELSDLFPFDQLKLVVSFLLKGLAYDLKSKGPSIQHAELLRLMTETRNLQSILWVYLFFKSRMGLIRSLYSRYGLTYSKSLSFERLAKDFIRLVEERYPSIMKLLKQAEKLGLKDNVALIIVLSQYRDAIRQLSPRLYKSLRHRQDLLMTILETLEELEEREEEEEEEEG